MLSFVRRYFTRYTEKSFGPFRILPALSVLVMQNLQSLARPFSSDGNLGKFFLSSEVDIMQRYLLESVHTRLLHEYHSPFIAGSGVSFSIPYPGSV